jgi:hypothetical protein
LTNEASEWNWTEDTFLLWHLSSFKCLSTQQPVSYIILLSYLTHNLQLRINQKNLLSHLLFLKHVISPASYISKVNTKLMPLTLPFILVSWLLLSITETQNVYILKLQTSVKPFNNNCMLTASSSHYHFPHKFKCILCANYHTQM